MRRAAPENPCPEVFFRLVDVSFEGVPAEAILLQEVDWVTRAFSANCPTASARLATGDAELSRVEVGLECQLEPNGGSHGAKAREPSAEHGKIGLKHRGCSDGSRMAAARPPGMHHNVVAWGVPRP